MGTDVDQAREVANFRTDNCGGLSVAACDGLVRDAIHYRLLRMATLSAVAAATPALVGEARKLVVPKEKAPTVVADRDRYTADQDLPDVYKHQGTDAITGSGTVFDSITPTQPVYPGSIIPRSFEMALPNGERIWVAGNASEHIAEYAKMKAINFSPEAVRVASQEQLTSLQSALNAATQSGIRYSELIVVDGWELKFAPPRQSGQAPSVIHALYRGKN